MTLAQTIRCLRASLLALFVVAQVAGVIPLIYDHTLNVYEATPVAAHSHAHLHPTAVTPDADHHHGALDLHDQCCALHTLAGPLPQATGTVPVSFAGFHIVLEELLTLAGGSPGVLDRPPRPIL